MLNGTKCLSHTFPDGEKVVADRPIIRGEDKLDKYKAEVGLFTIKELSKVHKAANDDAKKPAKPRPATREKNPEDKGPSVKEKDTKKDDGKKDEKPSAAISAKDLKPKK